MQALAEAHEPKGVGLYIRGLSEQKQGTPKQAAKKARDNGISFVAIMAAWFDEHNGKPRALMSNGRDPDRIARYADAFADAGVHPWIWGFPRGGAEEAYVERMKRVSDAAQSVVGWLHDPELFYKWQFGSRQKPSLGMRGQPEFTGAATEPAGSKRAREAQAARLMALTLDALSERLGLGITSYGMAQYHRNFPWAQFGGHGFGSPQLYSVNAQQVDMGIDAWREHGWKHIVPSVPTFGKNSGPKLHDHLSKFVDGHEDIAGFIFWSWRQTHGMEWNVLARWAEWFQRGIVAASADKATA